MIILFCIDSKMNGTKLHFFTANLRCKRKIFAAKFHHKQSRLREENGFDVIGWIPLSFHAMTMLFGPMRSLMSSRPKVGV